MFHSGGTSSASSSSHLGSSHGGGTGPLPVHPVGVFRHIPHSASVDHALVSSFSFSSCGLHGISASRDRALRLYDVGAVMLRDAYLLSATGCELVTYTHTSDVVAYTASHTADASVYLLNLSTGKLLGGISDIIGTTLMADRMPSITGKQNKSSASSPSAAYGCGLTRRQLSREFPQALAFKRHSLSTLSDDDEDSDDTWEGQAGQENEKRVPSAAAPSSPPPPTLNGHSSSSSASSSPSVVTILSAASTSLVLHPTTDAMVTVRKDGWAQLIVPTIGRPIALIKPTMEDEAYASRRRRRLRACSIYSATSYHHRGNGGGGEGGMSNGLRQASSKVADMGGFYGIQPTASSYSSPIGFGAPDGGGYYTAHGGGNHHHHHHHHHHPLAYSAGLDYDRGVGVSSPPDAGGSEVFWYEYDGDHPHSSASFSPCGNTLSISRSTTVALYDLRNLGRGPIRVMPSAALMATKGRFDHEPPIGDKDTPILAGAQLGGGGVLLATATTGLSTLVDATTVYKAECDFSSGVRVLGSYNGGGFASQFFATGSEPELAVQQQRAHGGLGGAGYGYRAGTSSYALGASIPISSPNQGPIYAFPAPASCGAVFASPSEGCRSMVVQPATRRAHGTTSCYPVLIYEGAGEKGADGADARANSLTGAYKPPGAGALPAIVSHQLLPRDAGPTRTLAVNPRFSLIASAANTVQWWTLGDTPRVGVSAISQEQW